MQFKCDQRDASSDPALCLNPCSPPLFQSASFLQFHTCAEGLLCPRGPLYESANCAACLPTASHEKQPEDSLHIVQSVNNGDCSKGNSELDDSRSAAASELLPEVMRADVEEATPAVTCYIGQQQESLSQLRRSGLVRRRAERLERLSGLSQQSLQSLKPFHACQRSKKGSSHDDEEFSSFPGSFTKSSTPCQVRLEPLMVPLTNEALLGVVGSGLLTPTSSPHGSALTRSSSSDSLRSFRGKPGLVRQRAQEIETRMRLAGLTVPSELKRSNSLAKLGSLDFSSEDLCSVCSSEAETLLLLSLSPEIDSGMEWGSPTTSMLSRPGKNLHTPEQALPGEPRS